VGLGREELFRERVGNGTWGSLVLLGWPCGSGVMVGREVKSFSKVRSGFSLGGRAVSEWDLGWLGSSWVALPLDLERMV